MSGLTNLTKLYIFEGNPILDNSPLYPLLPLDDVDIDPIYISAYPPWDVNFDQNVDATDVELVVAALGQYSPSITLPRADVNASGHVDHADLLLVVEHASGLTPVDMPDAHLAAAVRATLGWARTSHLYRH